MGRHQINSGRGRKPAGGFGRGFREDRPRGRFSRDSEEPSGRFKGGFEADRPRRRFDRDSDGPGRRPFEMYRGICDKCGKPCTVPFKPTTGKPLYCSDCFRKNDDSFARSGQNPRGSSGCSAEDLEKIHKKLDKIMRALKID